MCGYRRCIGGLHQGMFVFDESMTGTVLILSFQSVPLNCSLLRLSYSILDFNLPRGAFYKMDPCHLYSFVHENNMGLLTDGGKSRTGLPYEKKHTHSFSWGCTVMAPHRNTLADENSCCCLYRSGCSSVVWLGVASRSSTALADSRITSAQTTPAPSSPLQASHGLVSMTRAPAPVGKHAWP